MMNKNAIIEGYAFLCSSKLSEKLWDSDNLACMRMSAIVDSIVNEDERSLAKLASSPDVKVQEYFDYMYGKMLPKAKSVAEALKYYGEKVGLVVSDKVVKAEDELTVSASVDDSAKKY